MVQWDFIVNPFTVTVTLAAKSQQLTLQGTLQQGRVLNPITISQSSTVPTTGYGHQDARNATGFITFYNGQSTQQFVPAGTILTSASGVEVVTDADASMPAADLTANPPVIGQTTVSAHAVHAGSTGNIQAYDINTPCCSSVVAKNVNGFTGGQDERDFQTVAKSDITTTAAPLKVTLAQSAQGALQGQLKTNEALVTPSCATTTTGDHQPGEEAVQVKVTVSETCSAVAYDQASLQTKVTALLTQQAAKQLGTGYSLLDTVQVSVKQATVNHTPPLVFLSFHAQGTWVYALSQAEQGHIKQLIAGKTKQAALHILQSLPGIERVSLQSSGFGDDTRIPKNLSAIHLMIFYSI